MVPVVVAVLFINLLVLIPFIWHLSFTAIPAAKSIRVTLLDQNTNSGQNASYDHFDREIHKMESVLDQTRILVGFTKLGRTSFSVLGWNSPVGFKIYSEAFYLDVLMTKIDTQIIELQKSTRSFLLLKKLIENTDSISSSEELLHIVNGIESHLVEIERSILSHRKVLEMDVEKNLFAIPTSKITLIGYLWDKYTDPVQETINIIEACMALALEVFNVAESALLILNRHNTTETILDRNSVNDLSLKTESVSGNARILRRELDLFLANNPRYEMFGTQLDQLDSLLELTELVGSNLVLLLNGLIARNESGNSQIDLSLISDQGFISEFSNHMYKHRLDFNDNNVAARLAYENLKESLSSVNYYGMQSINRVTDPIVLESLDYMDALNQLVPLIKFISDQTRPLNYLVLSHSADEIRPSGGFVSGVWVLTTDGLEVKNLEYFDVELLDKKEKIQHYPPPPDSLTKYMGTDQWFIRDVSWDPYFPTVASNAAHMFYISTGLKVDGVIGLNQWALLNIVEAMGDISVVSNRESISSTEIISVLEKRTDSEGRKYSDRIFRAILNDVQDFRLLSDIRDFVSATLQSFSENDLQIYFLDESIHKIVEDIGWTGSLSYSYPYDYIYVTDSNVGWSKSDRNIERFLEYTVDLSEYPTVGSDLRLRYKNHSGFSAAPCEPQWVDRGDSYSELKNACYWNLLRIFLPEDINNVTNTDMPLPSGSVAVEIHQHKADSDSFSMNLKEDGIQEVSGLLVTDVGQESSVRISYDRELDVNSELGFCNEYRLSLIKQPGVRNRAVELNFLFSPEQVVKFVNREAVYTNNTLEISDNLKSNLDIKILFEQEGMNACLK